MPKLYLAVPEEPAILLALADLIASFPGAAFEFGTERDHRRICAYLDNRPACKLVKVAGLEPAAPGSRNRCSTY